MYFNTSPVAYYYIKNNLINKLLKRKFARKYFNGPAFSEK